MANSRRRVLGAFVLIGAGLLASTFFLGWYVISGQGSNPQTNATETLRLLSVSVTGSGGGNWNGTYADAHLPHTGTIYLATALLVFGAVLIAAVVGTFLMFGGGGAGRRTVLALSLLAVVLAAAGPIITATAQPAAICSDAHGFSPPLGSPGGNETIGGTTCTWEFYQGSGGWYGPGQTTGPGDSFIGTSSQYGATQAWGPTAGWYLGIVGAVIMGTATALLAVSPKAIPSRGAN